METTEGLRVVDLADEFGISISETLSLCAVYGIEAPYGSSTVSPSAATLLRGLANGTIDPDNPDPRLLAEVGATMPSAQPPQSPVSSAYQDHEVASEPPGAAADEDDAWAEIPDPDDDGVDYDAYGVAGLGDLNPVRIPPKAEPTKIATPVPATGTPAANRHTPPVLPKPSATSGLGDSREARKAAEVAKYERRSGGRRRKDEPEVEREEYDPTKLKAQYDDIDQYVPNWLKYATVAAVLLVVGLGYSLFFAGGSSDEQAGVIDTPAFDIGTCFIADAGLWIDTINPLPCQAPHDGEIFASYTFPAALGVAYPEAANLESETRQSCGTSFTAYTGDSQVASPYRIGVSFPSQTEWNAGQRVAYCSVIDNSGGQLEGSAAR